MRGWGISSRKNQGNFQHGITDFRHFQMEDAFLVSVIELNKTIEFVGVIGRLRISNKHVLVRLSCPLCKMSSCVRFMFCNVTNLL